MPPAKRPENRFNREPRDQYLFHLILEQLRFGENYLEEALEAYAVGRHEYAEIARDIVLNAYATCTRLAARLVDGGDQLEGQIAAFGNRIAAEWPETLLSREIA